MSFLKSKDQVTSEKTEFIKSLLVPGEELEKFYLIGVEFLAITNKRLIIKDKDGIFDTNPSLTTIPISKLSGVSISMPIGVQVPALKFFTSGFSVVVKGFDSKAMDEAYNYICSKIL